MTSDLNFSDLKSFFERPVCQEVASSLKNGVELEIHVEEGGFFSLRKSAEGIQLFPGAPQSPDITFRIGRDIPRLLNELPTYEVSAIGITLFNWMLENQPRRTLRASVHVGTGAFLSKGYLGILMKGGAPIMQYLAKKGFGSVTQLSRGFSKLRKSP